MTGQATVLLNANVAFLAIPSVDTGDGHVSAAQISSYLSIVTSVGCILVGLLLIRQHRVKSKETAEEAVRPHTARCCLKYVANVERRTGS